MALLICVALPATALTEAELIDRVRQAEEISIQDAAIAVLLAAGRVEPGSGSASEEGETVGAQGAEIDLEAAQSQSSTLFPRARGSDEPVTTAEYAYMLVEGFELPRGLVYRLAPSPRYALRELRFRELIPDEYEATETLTGRQALSLLARIRAWANERGYGPNSGGEQ